MLSKSSSAIFSSCCPQPRHTRNQKDYVVDAIRAEEHFELQVKRKYGRGRPSLDRREVASSTIIAEPELNEEIYLMAG